MNELQELLDEFTTNPLTTITRDNGVSEQVPTMSLLERLDDAKTRGLKSSGGTAGGAKIPVNASAYDIEADMIRTIHTTASVHDRYTLASLPLGERLRYWASRVEVSVAVAWCRYWKGVILSLDASDMYIRGACPHCGDTEYIEARDGEMIRKDALVATVTQLNEGTHVGVVCLVCAHEWNGLDEVMKVAGSLSTNADCVLECLVVGD